MKAHDLVEVVMTEGSAFDGKMAKLALVGLAHGRKLPYAIAIDFDGTLHDGAYPEIGESYDRVIEKAKLAQAAGCRLILWTCREGELLSEAVNWCALQHGLDFDAINDSLPSWKEYYQNDPRKIGYDELWDDKAVNV